MKTQEEITMIFPLWRKGLRSILSVLGAMAVGVGVALCAWSGGVRAQEPGQPGPQPPKAEKTPQGSSPSAGTAKSGEPHSARWRVSWAVDEGAARMSDKPVSTTIARLLKFKRPADLPGKGTIPESYRTHRIPSIETTVWSVKGTLIEVAAERDGDQRLTVADVQGRQIIGVLPDPALAPKTGPFTARINATRALIDARFHPTLTEKKVHIPIEMIGIGYFGRFNKEENPSPEGFQLHPVFAVRFPGKTNARK
jgi:hypothetical protein